MKVTLDLRYVYLRGSERLCIDVVDEKGVLQKLPPMPSDVAIDNLHMILLDMLAQQRDSNAHPVIRPDSEPPTALIPKT